MKKTRYKRQDLTGIILKELQTLGGSGSRRMLREEIVADDEVDISYEDVFEPIISPKGTPYIPFDFDFNFGLINLREAGYVQKYGRTGDIVLTEKGRSADLTKYPTEEDEQKQAAYWEQKAKERQERKANKQAESIVPETEITEDETDVLDKWKIEILEQIKQFSPQKFESFSRLLLSQMGIKFDHEKGVKMSGDHGIDGYGYYESDEFRTSKVVVQCKRYTDAAVSEPEIDKFKGVMMSFSADYGIFITMSYFTKQAQKKAVQGGTTVTLIDGQRLIGLIEKYELHITPVQTYALDDYYYQED